MNSQEIISEIDATNHDSFLKNNISILHFFSDWKMDCLMVLPILESFAEEFNGKISFGKVNIDESEELKDKHGVKGVPSILFFKNGLVVDKLEKSISEDIFRDKLMCLI